MINWGEGIYDDDVKISGTERKIKKKRKLVIDDQKAIASETMKLQLSDTSDIVTTLDLAPPTKKLMHWKETGGVEKLFAFPGRSIVSKRLSRVFSQIMFCRPDLSNGFLKNLTLYYQRGIYSFFASFVIPGQFIFYVFHREEHDTRDLKREKKFSNFINR